MGPMACMGEGMPYKHKVWRERDSPTCLHFAAHAYGLGHGHVFMIGTLPLFVTLVHIAHSLKGMYGEVV